MPIRGSFQMSTGAGSFATTPATPAAPTITSFAIDDTTLDTAQVATFAATFGGGALTSWTLDVNDVAPSEYTGSSSPLSQTHTYSVVGNYTARLTAIGPGGSAQATISGIQVTAPAPPPPAPDLRVLGNGNVISDGNGTPSAPNHTVFVTAVQSAGGTTRVFTVENTGTGEATTSGLTVPTGFTVLEALSGTIAAGASDTFTVRLDDSVIGTKSGDISFATNVAGKNPYNFAISGEVVAASGEIPRVSFTLSTTVGDAPLSVTATDTSTGSPTSHRWRFTNGSVVIESTAANPTVSLTPAGLWSVTKWATNGAGTGVAFEPQFIVATTPSPGYSITKSDMVVNGSPLSINQNVPGQWGETVRVTPASVDGVVEWRLGRNYYGPAGYNAGGMEFIALYPGTRTVAAKVIETTGAEKVFAKQVNVVNQGYSPAKVHTPVPTKGWATPVGETVLTTETRFHEATIAEVAASEWIDDRFRLAFDPGEVLSTENIFLRDAAGTRIPPIAA